MPRTAVALVCSGLALLALPACSSKVGPPEAAKYWTAYYEAQAQDRALQDAAASHAINPLAWTSAAEAAIGIDVSARRRTEWLDWTRVNRRQEYDARSDAAVAYVKRRLERVAAMTSVEALLRVAQSDTGPVAQAALDAAVKRGAGADEKLAEQVTAAKEHISKVMAILPEGPSPSPAASPAATGAGGA